MLAAYVTEKTMIQTPKTVTIVIPTYLSENHVGDLLGAIEKAAGRSAYDWSVVIVDDGSADNTWRVLCDEKPRLNLPVKAIRLSRNHGQHNAILTGLAYSEADYVVTMDDDLQHDPADIDAMLEKLEAGCDLVIGAFAEKKHALARNVGGRIVDRLLRHIFKVREGFQLTAFRAFRRVVAQQAVNSRAAYPYLTALLLSNATRIENIPVSHTKGVFRGSHYSLTRSVRLSANLLFGYTNLPVIAMIAASVLAIFSAMGAFVWVLVQTSAPNGTSPGWASIIAITSLFHGFTLISLAIIGVYVSRIHAVTTRESWIDSVDEING